MRNIQDRQYGTGEGRIGVDLGHPDFCMLANAFGLRAERVASIDEYAAAVKRGVGGGWPCLIEVDLYAIGPMVVPYTGTSRPPAV